MRILFVFLVLLGTGRSWALDSGSVNLNGGVGLSGTRGILGLSVDYFLTKNHVLNGAAGLDMVGATTSVGYRYFGGKFNTSGTFWDKCLFIFECDEHLYGGGSFQYAGPTTSKISDSTGTRTYETGAKNLALVVVGSREIFQNNLTFDFELSYRSILSGGEFHQTSGPIADDKNSLELGYHILGVGIAIGYLF